MSSLSSYRFFHQLRVRYSEIDGQRIVFNAHYLTYTDVTIHEYLRQVLGPAFDLLGKPDGFEFVLARAEIDYKKSARFDDLLKIYCRVTEMGKASFKTSFAIVRAGDEELLVEVKKIWVSVDLEKGCSRAIPAEIRQKIAAFEQLDSRAPA